MKLSSRGFTLIELLVVVVLIAVLAGILLPILAKAKKRAMQIKMRSEAAAATATRPDPKAPQQETKPPQRTAPAQPDPPRRPPATIKSFVTTVSLKPKLSVGTATPESICTAQLKAKLQAFDPGGGTCELLLPLPPQIISLADLEVTINSQPSESIEVRGDKLVWFGTLPAEPASMTVTYSAVGKGIYHLQTPAALCSIHSGLI